MSNVLLSRASLRQGPRSATAGSRRRLELKVRFFHYFLPRPCLIRATSSWTSSLLFTNLVVLTNSLTKESIFVSGLDIEKTNTPSPDAKPITCILIGGLSFPLIVNSVTFRSFLFSLRSSLLFYLPRLVVGQLFRRRQNRFRFFFRH